jgi:hypothetical protein
LDPALETAIILRNMFIMLVEKLMHPDKQLTIDDKMDTIGQHSKASATNQRSRDTSAIFC